jgi:hypothetical protein
MRDQNKRVFRAKIASRELLLVGPGKLSLDAMLFGPGRMGADESTNPVRG